MIIIDNSSFPSFFLQFCDFEAKLSFSPLSTFPGLLIPAYRIPAERTPVPSVLVTF